MARDTDLDWSIIARHHPFFGVLANERFLTPNLTPEVIDDFYATGVADIDGEGRPIGVDHRHAAAPVDDANQLGRCEGWIGEPLQGPFAPHRVEGTVGLLERSSVTDGEARRLKERLLASGGRLLGAIWNPAPLPPQE